jgi:hypothetical protein
MNAADHAGLVMSHYTRLWGVPGTMLPAPASPRRHELPVEFAVVEFAPHTTRDMWTYATLAMSQPGDTKPLELHMFSYRQAPQLVELLTAVAHYHRTGNPLGVGHTVNFGRPWLAGSSCDHGLVSLPYLDGPTLEDLPLPGGQIVKVDWLIPVTTAEVRFKHDHGLDALEQRMEEAAFDYLDPNRPSVS